MTITLDPGINGGVKSSTQKLHVNAMFAFEFNIVTLYRIKILEKTVEDKNGEIVAVKSSQSAKMYRDER